MNKMTATENPFYVDELLSPTNQPMADVEATDTPTKTNVLLGILGGLTRYSYDAWVARGGMRNSVE